MRTIPVLISFAALSIGGLILFYLGGRDPQVFGAAGGTDTAGLNFARYGSAFSAMCIGILLGSIFRHLQEIKTQGQKTIGSYREMFIAVLRSLDFAMSVVAAPLIYVFLLKTLDGADTWGIAVIALQNGFFCNVIIQKLIERSESA